MHTIVTTRRTYNIGYRSPTLRGSVLRQRAVGLGDATQDGLDLTMQDRASGLIAAFNGGSVSSAYSGDVANFQTAWNNSTPGQNMKLTVDGLYGPMTAQALGQALAFVPNGGSALGGTAPAPFNFSGGGGGGGGGNPPVPTIIIPGTVTPGGNTTVTTSSTPMNAWVIGGAVVLAALIAGWAYYEKGGGKHHLRRVSHRMRRRHA